MTIDDFFYSYVECALWSSNDYADESGGEPLDENYGPSDISEETLASMRADCMTFYAVNRVDLIRSGLSDEQAGRDFWLTRNGHGAGFWDRGLGAVGERLSKAAKAFGGVDLYVGDDGRIYS